MIHLYSNYKLCNLFYNEDSKEKHNEKHADQFYHMVWSDYEHNTKIQRSKDTKIIGRSLT